MLFITNQEVNNEELRTINNFFVEFEAVQTVTPEEAEASTPVSRYITSLANACYTKSVDEIANTKIGNTIKRKRNLQQVMQESFFYGANRFGNNFIA